MLDAIVFMKAGTHADESLDDILDRKRVEEQKTGRAYWGYRGNLCDPVKQVRPFVEDCMSRGLVPRVLMPLTTSPDRGEPTEARVMSTDGHTWEPLPSDVHVVGSKCALVVRDLSLRKLRVDLDAWEIAAGPKEGTPMSGYVRHRVDKACARRVKPDRESVEPRDVLVGELVEPWAVYVRSSVPVAPKPPAPPEVTVGGLPTIPNDEQSRIIAEVAADWWRDEGVSFQPEDGPVDPDDEIEFHEEIADRIEQWYEEQRAQQDQDPARGN